MSSSATPLPDRPDLPDLKVLPFEKSGAIRRTQQDVDEAKVFARLVVQDPAYRLATLRAARKRELPPAIETLLWQYAYGKPVEKMEVGKPGELQMDLGELSPAELAARARAVAAMLESAESEEPEAPPV